MQSKVDTLTARKNGAGERISDVGDKLRESKGAQKDRYRQLETHENRFREINYPVRCSNVRMIGITPQRGCRKR